MGNRKKVSKIPQLVLMSLFLSSPSWGQIVFHGSPRKFISPLPMENRSSQGGQIVWVGSGVFASHDLRVAVAYTAERFADHSYSFEVDLVRSVSDSEPLKLILYGGSSKNEALEKLYGRRTPRRPNRSHTSDLSDLSDLSDQSVGYIYCMNSKEFKREPGLGKMEWVSRKSPQLVKSKECIHGKKVIPRRETLERFIRQGLIQVEWMPRPQA